MVSEDTIRVDAFKAVYSIINANKPSGWTVLSSFPEVSPTFPCIVINPAFVTTERITMSNGTTTNRLAILVEFFAKARDLKIKIDQGRDNVLKTIKDNQATLRDTHKLIYVSHTDASVDTFVYGDQKINGGSSNIVFDLAK